MKHLKIDKFIIPSSILLFNGLFWSEKMGLNALIFTLVIIGALARKYKGVYNYPLIATIIGTLVAVVMVVVVNSALSKTVLVLSSFTMAGFFHREDLKFIGFSLLATLRQILSTPAQLLSGLFRNETVSKTAPSVFRNYMNYGVIPTFVFGGFLILYSIANDKFADLVVDYVSMIFGSSDGMNWISFDQVMFFLLSVFVVGALLLKPVKDRFAKHQAAFGDQLKRKRVNYFGYARFKMLALRAEYKVGFIMMIALNALLFLVNLTDIVYVWFSFEPMSASALSRFVHEGTYILILSIFFAMAVLLYYFRGNINFLNGIKPLKYAALIWIIQNTVLATSVGIRNFHYIKEYGLASKRIGVLVFLVLTVIGLLLMWVKIRDRKSIFFLLDRNAWAVYGMLIFLSLFNWDVLMTRYNLSVNSNKQLDVNYLIAKLSDKNLGVLVENWDLMLERAPNREQWIDRTLMNKQRRFLRMQSSYSVLSWNYQDWRVKQLLN